MPSETERFSCWRTLDTQLLLWLHLHVNSPTLRRPTCRISSAAIPVAFHFHSSKQESPGSQRPLLSQMMDWTCCDSHNGGESPPTRQTLCGNKAKEVRVCHQIDPSVQTLPVMCQRWPSVGFRGQAPKNQNIKLVAPAHSSEQPDAHLESTLTHTQQMLSAQLSWRS